MFAPLELCPAGFLCILQRGIVIYACKVRVRVRVRVTVTVTVRVRVMVRVRRRGCCHAA